MGLRSVRSASIGVWVVSTSSEGEVLHSECVHECQLVHQTPVLMVFRGREEPQRIDGQKIGTDRVRMAERLENCSHHIIIGEAQNASGVCSFLPHTHFGTLPVMINTLLGTLLFFLLIDVQVVDALLHFIELAF